MCSLPLGERVGTRVVARHHPCPAKSGGRSCYHPRTSAAGNGQWTSTRSCRASIRTVDADLLKRMYLAGQARDAQGVLLLSSRWTGHSRATTRGGRFGRFRKVATRIRRQSLRAKADRRSVSRICLAFRELQSRVPLVWNWTTLGLPAESAATVRQHRCVVIELRRSTFFGREAEPIGLGDHRPASKAD